MWSAVRGDHGGDTEHVPLTVHRLGHLFTCQTLVLMGGHHHPTALPIHAHSHRVVRMAVVGDGRHSEKVYGYAVHEVGWHWRRR